MAKTMTPSVMSEGQIDKAVADFRASLRKYRGDFSRDAVQWVLGLNNPTFEAAQALYFRVKAIDDMHVRRVRVDSFDRKHRSVEEKLRKTGLQLFGEHPNREGERQSFPNLPEVELVPRGEADDVTLYLFQVGSDVHDTELEQQYAWRGLKPADPYSLFALQAAEPDFIDKIAKAEESRRHQPYGYATHWRNRQGKWCYIGFRRDEIVIGRHTKAYRLRNDKDKEANGGDYGGGEMFAGVRK